mmetsp:Transcript_28136/g.82871  ORF Transcript_28136/g.82871 Transcript_28136/m.82871 type:complete len:201 (+) Transcript_28136:34-636(+)
MYTKRIGLNDIRMDESHPSTWPLAPLIFAALSTLVWADILASISLCTFSPVPKILLGMCFHSSSASISDMILSPRFGKVSKVTVTIEADSAEALGSSPIILPYMVSPFSAAGSKSTRLPMDATVFDPSCEEILVNDVPSIDAVKSRRFLASLLKRTESVERVKISSLGGEGNIHWSCELVGLTESCFPVECEVSSSPGES